MIQKLPLILIAFLALSLENGCCFILSNVEQGKADENPCFYINLNRVYEHKVVEIQQPLVCLEYQDPYGKDLFLILTFYDWQHQLIASVKMPKKYGKNEYPINLLQLGLPFNNQIFTLETLIENGKKLKAAFRLIPPPEMPNPIVNIVVNPIALACGKEEGNQIEFYGKIEGGKAPYMVEWTITNAAQSALLYQPSKSTLAKEGITPVIEVEQSPAYLVNLVVTDGCGKQGKQTVSVRCDENPEKPNSLLFQPVPVMPTQQAPAR